MQDCVICHQPIIGRRSYAKTCLNTTCQVRLHSIGVLACYHRAYQARGHTPRPCALKTCAAVFTRTHAAQKFCTPACRHENALQGRRGNYRTLGLTRALKRGGWLATGGVTS